MKGNKMYGLSLAAGFLTRYLFSGAALSESAVTAIGADAKQQSPMSNGRLAVLI